MPASDDDESGPPPVASAALAGRAGRDRLPEILSLLEREDVNDRIAGTWAACVVAEADREAVDRIVRRLVDQHAEAETDEGVTLLDYLLRRYPEETRAVLVAIEDRAASRRNRERLEALRELAASTPGEGVFGGTRLSDQSRDQSRKRPEANAGAAGGDRGGYRPGDEYDGEEIRQRNQQERVLDRAAARARIEDIAAESRFDELHLVSPAIHGRYSDIYRTRAVSGSTEEGIALRLFEVPSEREDTYAEAICSRLADWQALADDERVVRVYDFGREPTLWVATEYVTSTLYHRRGLSPRAAVHEAVRVAETVSHAHENGVVHTGLDPYSVVYPDGTIDGPSRPQLANFGLLDVLRRHFEPSEYLDPRYAAPEYFERRYGTIDHMTDIYHVGALLYRLVTDQPPVDGTYDEVRDAVLHGEPPRPSSVRETVPARLDEIVGKAMAGGKLTRYETAGHLAQELGALLGDAR